jgi:hypothetical protein
MMSGSRFQALDRDVAIALGVVRQVDGAHAAGGEVAHHLVAAEANVARGGLAGGVGSHVTLIKLQIPVHRLSDIGASFASSNL